MRTLTYTYPRDSLAYIPGHRISWLQIICTFTEYPKLFSSIILTVHTPTAMYERSSFLTFSLTLCFLKSFYPHQYDRYEYYFIVIEFHFCVHNECKHLFMILFHLHFLFWELHIKKFTQFYTEQFVFLIDLKFFILKSVFHCLILFGNIFVS